MILGTKHPIKKLVELIPNEKAVVFGTLYKQQELKPNILREISDEVMLLMIHFSYLAHFINFISINYCLFLVTQSILQKQMC